MDSATGWIVRNGMVVRNGTIVHSGDSSRTKGKEDGRDQRFQRETEASISCREIYL